jgi:hypothetical protein
MGIVAILEEESFAIYIYIYIYIVWIKETVCTPLSSVVRTVVVYL